MVKISQQQIQKIKALAKQYKESYLDVSRGREHIRAYRREREEVKKAFSKIKEKRTQGENITDDVLYKLLPHTGTKYNREQGHRVSTWPAITKDIKKWFENAGWQKKKNWPKVASEIFDLIEGLLNGKGQEQILKFVNTEYSKGFQAGIISPIIYCLDKNFLVVNSKIVDTINFIVEQEIIDSRLENYLENIKKVRVVIDQLDIELFKSSFENFDAFCHWMCYKKLGGYARIRREEKDIEPTELVGVESHGEAIGKLLELGKWLKFDRCVGRVEAGKDYKGRKLQDFANRREIPDDLKAIKDIKHIDVIWYDKYSPPHYIFEVDFKGNVRSALRKLYQARNINAEFFVVSPVTNREKLDNALTRDPYRSSSKMFRFISFEDLEKLYESAEIFFKNKKELLE